MENVPLSHLELDLARCVENYRYFRSLIGSGTRLLVLVKANAYGHGAAEFASMMQSAGADALAVAYPVEGVELRRSGITLPIIVLTAGTGSYREMVQYRLEPGIPDTESLKILCEVLESLGVQDYPVHVKLDTGMHRLGFMTGELEALADFLRERRPVRVRSVYSHLSAADDPAEDDFTRSQAALFLRNADLLSSRLGYRPMYHLLNSAGIERFPEYQFDMVRLGIGVYGVSALRGVKLAPAASLKCRILQIKTLTSPEETVGYGRHGRVSPSGTVTATIPLGYADGIDRRLGRGRASFSLNGHRVPTIGNICMDMCMLDITGVEAEAGDTVTIFGEDPTVTELSELLGTIPYEVLTSVSRRVRRIVRA